MRYRFTVKTTVGRKTYEVDEEADVGEILGAMPHLAWRGHVVPVEAACPDYYVLYESLARGAANWYVAGQILPAEDVSPDWVKVGYAGPVSERVVMNAYACEQKNCNAVFVTKKARQEHKRVTGHKRKYSPRKSRKRKAEAKT